MELTGSTEVGSGPRVAVVGADWSGVSAGRVLHDAGCRVRLFEASYEIGGHSRAASVNGVVFEPQGPHIFHTRPARRGSGNAAGCPSSSAVVWPTTPMSSRTWR
ncbi:NAD(P)-binding protein [Streptomyces solisilvae]|uniref:NAD(P)-binding protein n=1 Tax=Streptomyces malaysiensis TaxID=92644 RepID=UPI0036A24AB2